jgi:hypothetical protein
MIKSKNDFVTENIRLECRLINPYCKHLLQILLICDGKTRPDGKWILILVYLYFHVSVHDSLLTRKLSFIVFRVLQILENNKNCLVNRIVNLIVLACLETLVKHSHSFMKCYLTLQFIL